VTAAAEHRHVLVERHGGPHVLQLRRSRTGEPTGDRVRVRVRAAGVAFGDVLLREGIRRDPRPPLVPGYDVAGVVDAVGPDAPAELLGQTVAAWTGGAGGYTEVLEAPAWAVAPHPAHLDPARAVAVVLNYVTAWQMLHRVARVRPGDRLVVHGAAGGVGTALLQLCRDLDVEVFGTASRRKHDLVRSLGAHPIDYATEDFVEVVRAAGGADAVFDPIGGSHWRRSAAALTGAGTLVGYGFAAATVGGRRRIEKAVPAVLGQPVHTPLTLMQRVRSMAGYRIEKLADERPDWFTTDLTHLLSLLAAGTIDPIVERVYPLERAADAHTHLASADLMGKLILTTGDSVHDGTAP
jgi:NADPH:quinone reductase-like Zn-dependent oxidoreductase